MSSVCVRGLAVVAAMAACCAPAISQGIIERPKPLAGEVLTIRGGEELQLKAAADWRTLVAEQDVIGGDTVRTNAAGAVAILFEDRTQVRVGRNSTLLVKDIARSPDGTTELSLEQGSIWARAARGGAGVRVDTPAAAAAIRGTDWSLTTEGRKTSLIVLDGEVELKNPQGAVTVRRGEGAEAVVGQAPRKVAVVNLDAREQIILYRDLADSFAELTPSDLSRRGERAARASALARPEGARTAEDWLTLAETGMVYDGAAASARALSRAEARGLDPRQKARAELVRCFVEARARRWAVAASICARAAPRLDPARRATAAYLAWAARRQGNPADRTPPPPTERYQNQATGVLARASVESFLDGPKKGLEVIENNLARFPNDVMMRAGRGLLYIMLGDKAAAKKAIDEAFALDPDDPYVLVARARYRHAVQSDLEGAIADLRKAQKLAPGADYVWLETSLVEDMRDATHEAEAAHLKAIELNQQNPLNHSNYAVFLIDAGRLAQAKQEIEAAEAIEPGGFFNLYARGYLSLARGDTEEGIRKLLGATAISPDASSTQIALAIANYQSGNLVETDQALDNADQFDADDPLTPTIRSIIAVDQYRADEAILSAREALKRRRARGGDFATIDANRQNGSFVASSLRFLGLDEWGRYYGDRVADAFASSAYFDQAIVSAQNPFEAIGDPVAPGDFNVAPTAFSSLVQGLLIEPLGVASSERRTSIIYHPFFEVAGEAGFIKQGDHYGWRSNATLQTTVMEPFPVAVFSDVSFERPDGRFPNDRADEVTGVTLIGAKPTPYDRVTLFNVVSNQTTGGRLFDRSLEFLPADGVSDNARTLLSYTGAAWAHEFSERNVVQAMVAGTTLDQRTQTGFLPLFTRGVLTDAFSLTEKVRQRQISYGASHLLGIGDVTLRYGAEGLHARFRLDQRGDFLVDPAPGFFSQRPDGDGWRVYADATWDVTPDLKVQGGLYRSELTVGGVGDTRDDPRIGVAWQPLEGHWLRAAYRKDSLGGDLVTLAPVTTVGLSPMQTPIGLGGRTETLAARWDAEWSANLFSAIEYQRQDIRNLTVDIPESFESVDLPRASIDRLTVSANVWLTHGFGAFASYTRTWSQAKSDGLSFFSTVTKGDDVPFLPEHAGRIGLVYVSPAMWKVAVTQNVVGARVDPLGQRLDRFTTTNASAIWELFDKRLALKLDALNVFDRRVELFGPLRRVSLPPLPDADQGELLAGGRTVVASARLRF